MDRGGAMFLGFLGEYQHTLDPKGRVILPAEFRDEMSDGVVMTIGLDRCVTIYPAARWLEVRAELRLLKINSAKQRQYQRMVRSQAKHTECDRQGRVLLTTNLREYAGLGSSVTLVGDDDKVEIWDSAAWEAYKSDGLQDVSETDDSFLADGTL